MSKNTPELTAEKLRELLSYDQKTGLFTWIRHRHASRIGTIAGSPCGKGYVLISIDCVSHKAHRLAWLYVYGSWPQGHIDHKNRVRGDNKIKNLRQASPSQNQQNRKIGANNTSGCVGIVWMRSIKKWHARIDVNGKRIHIGSFSLKDDAIAARAAAKQKLHAFNPEQNQI